MKSSSPGILKIPSHCLPSKQTRHKCSAPSPRCPFQQSTYQHAVKTMKKYVAESVLEIHIFPDVEKMFGIYVILLFIAEVYE